MSEQRADGHQTYLGRPTSRRCIQAKSDPSSRIHPSPCPFRPQDPSFDAQPLRTASMTAKLVLTMVAGPRCRFFLGRRWLARCRRPQYGNCRALYCIWRLFAHFPMRHLGSAASLLALRLSTECHGQPSPLVCRVTLSTRAMSTIKYASSFAPYVSAVIPLFLW